MFNKEGVGGELHTVKRSEVILLKSNADFLLALQCRLECEPGYVAQRVPLITCVNGEYEKGCH